MAFSYNVEGLIYFMSEIIFNNLYNLGIHIIKFEQFVLETYYI